ncbi:MAG: hypothetical protein QXV84_05700 [Conexivisphaerales archaeon]
MMKISALMDHLWCGMRARSSFASVSMLMALLTNVYSARRIFFALMPF